MENSRVGAAGRKVLQTVETEIPADQLESPMRQTFAQRLKRITDWQANEAARYRDLMALTERRSPDLLMGHAMALAAANGLPPLLDYMALAAAAVGNGAMATDTSRAPGDMVADASGTIVPKQPAALQGPVSAADQKRLDALKKDGEEKRLPRNVICRRGRDLRNDMLSGKSRSAVHVDGGVKLGDGSTQMQVTNPGHYRHDQNGTYDHRNYTIEFPPGQNVDANMAAAKRKNAKIMGRNNTLREEIEKYHYLHYYCATGSIGDFGKNHALYPDTGDPARQWARRLGANFNLGAMGAAMGYGVDALLDIGNGLSIENTWPRPRLHPPNEQDAIEDGYWYYHRHHPSPAVIVPKGTSVR